MPAENKGKSVVRKAPYTYDARRRAQFLVPDISSSSQFVQTPPGGEDLKAVAQYPLENSDRASQKPKDFIHHLSSYLRSKNEAYKKELGNMEGLLMNAEENSKNLKDTVIALGLTVDSLESTVAAAADSLSASLTCAVCLECVLNPTSLKCGHSFCHECLQSWFLKLFEGKCDELKIDLTKTQYKYIYEPSSTAVEAQQKMVKFAKLSYRVDPSYSCPTCRDPLLPLQRNSFPDFKLSASLTSLNKLIGYVRARNSDWKLASIDFISFLNSRFFRKHTEGRNLSMDDMGDMDAITEFDVYMADSYN